MSSSSMSVVTLSGLLSMGLIICKSVSPFHIAGCNLREPCGAYQVQRIAHVLYYIGCVPFIFINTELRLIATNDQGWIRENLPEGPT
ncbi:hypothetical protein BDR06DRAFT_55895 [Suillus hirtellus]|nr:hypothetical protein BDR06DRAFT_55895 [Suillus hirtellus]